MSSAIASPAANGPPPQCNPAPNAAVIYWQAFALMPKLTDEEDAAPKQGISEKTGQASKEVRELVFNFEEPLRSLQRASEVEPCDWQLDLPAGPELTLARFQKAIELRSIALLRAKIRFENDDSHSALADTLATFKLARDCGASPLIISYIIGMTIEKSATEVLLDNWGELDADQRSRLRAAITELPKKTQSMPPSAEKAGHFVPGF